MKKHETRETYLSAAVELFRPMFKEAGSPLPEKIQCCPGWPSSRALSPKKRAIGECWPPGASRDKTVQVFISPYLEEPKGQQGVLDTLAHELVHAADGNKNGHKGPFVRLARAIGLEGKPTCTHCGEELEKTIAGFSSKLGDYPHARLDRTKSPVKKQGTRLIKCECPECGFIVRTTQKWLDAVGAPHCPKHGQMEVEAAD